MAVVIGVAGDQVRELTGKGADGKGYDEPLKSFSIEGLSFLVRPAVAERLNLEQWAGRLVKAVVSVQWKGAGKRPSHWLSDIQAAEVR